ncbi:hypothetical protein NDU88_008285 [Pleurodeles waltl]|uniref:Uncharacterized protein n=1 Tax=Pleurodeles waltl TaxID=8319 RepID=A0AAV7RRW0_PLEWA|nr:hypothetical protein NDU88_008285 [Pleurodeles waltl]
MDQSPPGPRQSWRLQHVGDASPGGRAASGSQPYGPKVARLQLLLLTCSLGRRGSNHFSVAGPSSNPISRAPLSASNRSFGIRSSGPLRRQPPPLAGRTALLLLTPEGHAQETGKSQATSLAAESLLRSRVPHQLQTADQYSVWHL